MAVKGVRISLNSKGVVSILRSRKVHDDLQRRAEAIAQAAGGDGYVAEESVAPDRAAVQVSTTTYEARAREARDRNLTRAIDAGRG